jgi:alpha-glucosidase
MKKVNKVQDVDNDGKYTYIKTDLGIFNVLFLTNEIIRIKYTFEKKFNEEASYALVLNAWDDITDDLLKDERKKVNPYNPKIIDSKDYICLNSDKLKVKIYKEPFGIDILDSKGNLMHSDLREKAYLKDNYGKIYHYSCMDDDDYFYGFGEKSGYINKSKRRMRMNNIDTLGYNAEYTDPLYKHIPFYIKLNKESQIACGMFYNNSYESVFDMGCERSGYWNKYSYFATNGGELDLFFINGPSIKRVVQNYTKLTGKTVLPPLHSLGYYGSTMFYTEIEEDSDEEILNFIDRTKEENIPCDGFFLSSGYTTGNNQKRHVFNWNLKRFKNPEKFIKKMKEKGANVSPNIKPGLLLSNTLYDEFKNENAFIRDENGKKSYIDRFWGGKASFVDFTNPKARELWKKYLIKTLISKGITCIWNDNCEYEINNTDAICENESKTNKIEALKPMMSNIMALVAKKALNEYYPNVRPYITNRAGFAGIQRYAQTWSGDNSTSWHSLKFNIPIMLGMGLSGVANQGSDIGGFYGPAPEPELLVRWVQNGIFQPRFSIHSCNTDNSVTEPWIYPSFTRYIKEAIQFRYNLIPYFYSLLYESSTIGEPVMRPLFYEFQSDTDTYSESFDFMSGKSLLVASVYEKGQNKRTVYLPKGCFWYDFYTMKRYKGGKTIEIETSLDRIPVFFRSGAIVPMTKGVKNLHLQEINKLDLLIEPWENSEFLLYEDDGISNDNIKGKYLKTLISVKSDDYVVIKFNKYGNYETKVKEFMITLVCIDKAPTKIIFENKELKFYLNEKKWSEAEIGWYFDNEMKTAKIKYNNIEDDYEIKVDFRTKDLISI